jgi:hypothetical protein
LTAVSPEVAPLTFELELGLSAGDADAAGDRELMVLAPFASLAYVLGTAIELELSLPFAVLTEDPSAPASERGLLAGNPAIGVHHLDRDPDGNKLLRVGAVLAAPLAGSTFGAHVGSLDAHGYVLAMQGGREAYLHAAEAFGLALPIELEARSGAFLYGCDFSFVALIYAEDKLASLIELAPLFGVRSGALSAGARVQLAWLPFSSEGDALVSLAPFVQMELSQHAFSYARFLLNLDEPVGVLAEGPTVWGLFLGTGARL